MKPRGTKKPTGSADRDKLKAAVNRCFATEDGRTTLRVLMDMCGWRETSVGGNPAMGMDILHGTLYSEARRGIYVELRSIIRPDILKAAEFYEEPKPTNQEGNT